MLNQDVMVTIVTFHCNYCVDTKMVSFVICVNTVLFKMKILCGMFMKYAGV